MNTSKSILGLIAICIALSCLSSCAILKKDCDCPQFSQKKEIKNQAHNILV